MNQMLDRWLATRQFLMVLLSTFATLALALACAGTYGVLAYVVGQRTRELGIRMALGASRASVCQWVLGYGGRLVLCSIVIGVGIAYGLTRLIASQLYGVPSSDPLTFTAATLALTVIAAGACFAPARRAMRIDPLIALRL
jgi:ABC-type antimicrobial peptide transport system permease subunit